MIGVIDILEPVMKALSDTAGEGLPTGEGDSTFRCYFNLGYLDQVGGTYKALLAIFGAPGTFPIRQCIETTKVQLIYGARLGSEWVCARNPGTYAYYNTYENDNSTIRSYLGFCKSFFEACKTRKHIDFSKNVSYVDATKLTAYINNTSPDAFPKVDSGASTILHELRHWLDITRRVVGSTQIADPLLTRAGR